MKYAVKKIISLLLSVSTMLFGIPVVHSQAEQETYIDGDVNADGVFNVADVVMMKQCILGMRKLVNMEAGDLCKDNIINVSDMCLMKRIFLETTDFKADITNVQWNADTRTVMADVTYEGISQGNGAWIGVIPSDTPHNELDADKTDVSYMYLSDFESGSFSGLKVPDGLNGNYDLRIYSNDDGGEELDCVTFCIDDSTVDGIRANITNVQWNADTRTVMADVTYEGISKGNGAWIGVVPSDTPHNEFDADKTDVSYMYLSSFESGSFLGIKVPYGISGNYDLRIYSDDNGGRELACVTFFIDESNIDEPTIDGFKGKITNIQWNADTRTIMADVTYEKIPEGNGAWIGVVPSDTPHNELDADKTDVCYMYLFDFESGSFPGLKVPDGLSGNYDLRVYSSDKEDGEELDCVTFTIS